MVCRRVSYRDCLGVLEEHNRKLDVGSKLECHKITGTVAENMKIQIVKLLENNVNFAA